MESIADSADAGFAVPEVCEYLEGDRIKLGVRLPADRVLRASVFLLKRPVGLGGSVLQRPMAGCAKRSMCATTSLPPMESATI
jgi:hypothetical protein